MRRCLLSVLPMLLSISLTGCFTGDTVHTSSWLERMRTPRLPLGPDGVLMDIVVIELPLGDKFLNGEVWDASDCQAVGLQRQGLLADNGLRVGQVIGMIPGQLQTLLSSDRHCVSKHRQLLPAGQKTVVSLGQAQPVCSFRLHTEAGATDVTLNQGQATLVIEPSLTDDGRTRLKFTPEVLYGAVLPDYQVAGDRSGMVLEFKRASKSYSSLSWEVALAPNQYLVVGTHFEDDVRDSLTQTLGSQFFLEDTNKGCVQRLLVMRTTRGDAGLTSDWSVAKGQMPDSNKQEDRTTDLRDTQPISPAAHCMASQ
jgi:hypothetical protein